MDRLKDFRFKTWHFGLLLLVLLIFTNILGPMTVKSIPNKATDSCFIELRDNTFQEAISSGINFVLIYKKDSDLCDKLEYNFCQLPVIKEKNINFYKLDIEKYPGRYSSQSISAAPTVLIYRDGKEIERIMGVIPKSNLEIIYNRVTK